MRLFLVPAARFLILLAAIPAAMAGCSATNNPPVINGLEAGTGCPAPSSEVDITTTAFDTEDDDLSYHWSATGGTFTPTGASAVWHTPAEPGSYTISVRVTDDRGGEAVDELVVSVRNNRPPVVEGLVVEPEVTVAGETVTIDCVASDPDGDGLSYEWSAERGNVMGKGNQVSWVAPATGDTYTVTVRVTDPCGAEVSRDIEIRVASEPCCPT